MRTREVYMQKTFMEAYPGIRRAIAESGGTIPLFMRWYGEVLAVYEELAFYLPDMMVWKAQKPEHARHCAREARELAALFGFNELEIAYFTLLFASHDLGRMVEGLRNLMPHGNLPAHVVARWPMIFVPERPHGVDSAILLREVVGGAFVGTTIGVWTLAAIEHHSDKENPTFKMLKSPEALALANIIRDLDKAEGFREAMDYTANPERKAKERRTNWPGKIKNDPSWGTELGCIDPQEALDEFEQNRAIDRRTCRSYEAYMLQYLAWVKSIVQPEMRKLALREGGPQIVAAYLLKQLEASPEQRGRLEKAFAAWNSGVLLQR